MTSKMCGDLMPPPLPPRCSTALDGDSLGESWLGSGSSLLVSSPVSPAENLSNLRKAIEALNLVATSVDTPHDTLWREPDSAYRSMHTLDTVSTSTPEYHPSAQLNEPSSDGLTLSTELNTSPVESNASPVESSSEPEVEILERFRRFGVRFIRHANGYAACKCPIPQPLLEWSALLSEVAVTSQDTLPLCFHYRWAEVKQNFNQDVFGDLQFQDFLLAREQRGPYHAMIHFAGIFANVGYDGSNWYWVLVGDGEMPFIESVHRQKENFVECLCSMIRQQFRLNRDVMPICPQPTPNAHMYVREAETEFETEAELPEHPCADPSSPTARQTDLLEPADLKTINGQRAPRGIPYVQLHGRNYSGLFDSP